MASDPLPRKKANGELFRANDQMETLSLPQDARLTVLASAIDAAIEADDLRNVRRACEGFSSASSVMER
jgi:hypothetical protein